MKDYRRHAVYARGMRHHILGWPFITKRQQMGASLDKISELLDRAADALEGTL